MKSYEQQCPVTRALDLVGDRWTLVIVRDLLDAPRRFGQLRAELVGISPTLLSERLRRLVDHDIVRRQGDRYALTSRGEALAPVVDELGRWGLDLMGRRNERATDVFHEHFRRLGMRFVLRPETMPDAGARIGFEVDGAVFVMEVAPAGVHSRLTIEQRNGADIGPVDARIRTDVASMYAARRGRRSLEELEQDGIVEIVGAAPLTSALRAALTPA